MKNKPQTHILICFLFVYLGLNNLCLTFRVIVKKLKAFERTWSETHRSLKAFLVK